MKPRRLVLVEWTDALQGPAEWAEAKDLPTKAMPTQSVGWVVRESKAAITLAALTNRDHVGLSIVIPTRMIDAVHELVPFPPSRTRNPR